MKDFYAKNQYDRWELNEPVLEELVTQIAQAMGWQSAEKKDGCWYRISSGDKSLSIRAETSPNRTERDNPRITIGAKFTYTKDGILHDLWQHIPRSVYESYTTDISCGVKRGADAIARDIEKRLLPGYFELWDKAVILEQQHDEKVNRLKTRTKDLGAIIGAYPHPNWSSGDTIASHPKFKQELGINGKGIDIEAQVSSYGDDVRFKMSMPYEVATELMQWVSTKTVSCFDTWREEMVKSCIRWLDREAYEAELPEITELPPNTFDWQDAYNKYWKGGVDGYFSDRAIFETFKKSIIGEEMKPQQSTRADPDHASSDNQNNEDKTMQDVTLEQVLELAQQLTDAEQAQLVAELMQGIAERLEDKEVETEE